MMYDMMGNSSSKLSLTKNVGRGSSAQDLEVDESINLRTSSFEAGARDRSCDSRGSLHVVGSTASEVELKLSWIFLTLSVY